MISVAPTSLFSCTLKPLARSAWAYSSPRRNCSGKFLVPKTTGGLPAPGPVAVLDVWLLDDPHPARPRAATTRNAAARVWRVGRTEAVVLGAHARGCCPRSLFLRHAGLRDCEAEGAAGARLALHPD